MISSTSKTVQNEEHVSFFFEEIHVNMRSITC